MSGRLGVAALVVTCLASSAASAERPRTLLVPQPGAVDLTPAGTIPYNTIYLNNCQPNGCQVTRAQQSNSINDTWPIQQTRTLSKFAFDDATWQKVVSCVKDTFSPFNVEIVTDDPGSANHFEIMIAGYPQDLGMSSAIGGVAPGGVQCGQFQSNALVFDFAQVWSGGQTTCSQACIEEICSTAAQEIGHAWSLDHVTTAADPMTYNPFTGRRYFQNTDAKCGSDCVNGMQYGLTCGGTNGQERVCYPCTNSTTQNSYEQIGSFFGFGPGTPPTVTITSPKNGANVMAGFPVMSTATDDSEMVKVELTIDGTKISELAKGPFVFNSPATLGNGTHHVEITATDPHGTPGKAAIDVYIGPPCDDSSDCERENDVCIGGRCVPGPGVDGGLGDTCAGNQECLSGACASDGTHSYCVEDCSVGQCPGDFGCLDTGAGDGTGICWPGYDDGAGCGCNSNHPGGPVTMGLLFGVVVFTWRRRRR